MNELVNEKVFDINQICDMYKLSSVYVRRMMLNGTLPSHKVFVKGTKIQKNVVTEEDLKIWRSKTHQHRRTDGRNRFVLHADVEEIEMIRAYIKNEKLGAEISKQNASKREEVEESAEIEAAAE